MRVSAAALKGREGWRWAMFFRWKRQVEEDAKVADLSGGGDV